MRQKSALRSASGRFRLRPGLRRMRARLQRGSFDPCRLSPAPPCGVLDAASGSRRDGLAASRDSRERSRLRLLRGLSSRPQNGSRRRKRPGFRRTLSFGDGGMGRVRSPLPRPLPGGRPSWSRADERSLENRVLLAWAAYALAISIPVFIAPEPLYYFRRLFFVYPLAPISRGGRRSHDDIVFSSRRRSCSPAGVSIASRTSSCPSSSPTPAAWRSLPHEGFLATTKSELPTGKRSPARVARFSSQCIHHSRRSRRGEISLRSDCGAEALPSRARSPSGRGSCNRAPGVDRSKARSRSLSHEEEEEPPPGGGAARFGRPCRARASATRRREGSE